MDKDQRIKQLEEKTTELEKQIKYVMAYAAQNRGLVASAKGITEKDLHCLPKIEIED